MSEFVRIALIAIAGCLVLAGVADAAMDQYRRAVIRIRQHRRYESLTDRRASRRDDARG